MLYAKERQKETWWKWVTCFFQPGQQMELLYRRDKSDSIADMLNNWIITRHNNQVSETFSKQMETRKSLSLSTNCRSFCTHSSREGKWLPSLLIQAFVLNSYIACLLSRLPSTDFADTMTSAHLLFAQCCSVLHASEFSGKLKPLRLYH